MARLVQVPYDYNIVLPAQTAQAVQKNKNDEIMKTGLSLKALGLLVNLLSYPPSWELHKTELYKRFIKDGQKSVASAWKDLVDNNYIIEFKYRKGKKYEYVYYLRKVPFTEEEKNKILKTAIELHGDIWALPFGESNLESSKRQVNINNILNKKNLLKNNIKEDERESILRYNWLDNQ